MAQNVEINNAENCLKRSHNTNRGNGLLSLRKNLMELYRLQAEIARSSREFTRKVTGR